MMRLRAHPIFKKTTEHEAKETIHHREHKVLHRDTGIFYHREHKDNHKATETFITGYLSYG